MLKRESVAAYLDYDPDTGIIRRRVRGGKVPAGAIAGFLSGQGYRIIRVCGAQTQAHRLAWLLHYGEWPAREIDHINGVRDDNRIINLRLATRTENNWNTRARADNTSGFKGVYYHKTNNRWVAKIQRDGRRLFLGCFPTKEAAAAAVIAVRADLHGQYARGE